MADNDNEKEDTCDRCYVREIFDERLIDFLKILLTEEQKLELRDWLNYSKNPFADEEASN